MFVRVPLGDITVIPAPEQDGAYSPNTVVTLLYATLAADWMSGNALVWAGVDASQEGTAYIAMLEDRFVEIQPRFSVPHPNIPCG